MNLHATEWDHPEYLTRADWDNEDYWSAKPLGGGERYRYGMSTNWSYDANKNAFFNLMFYGYAMNLTRYRDMDTWVREEYHDREMYGGSGSYIWSTAIGTMHNTLTVGVDGQVELTHTINADNPGRSESTRGTISVDGESNIRTYSGYFQNQLALNQAWEITLGGRYDHIEGDLENNLPDGEDADMDDFNIFSPKAGLTFYPAAGYTLFTTYGQGFRLPGGSDKFTYPDLKEETYTQYELGLKLTRFANLESTLTGFILETEDEIVTDDTAGTKKNQGNTRRTGVELEVKYTPTQNIFLFGTCSYTQGEYVDFVDNGVDYSDTDIERIPDWVYSFGAEWRPSQGFFAGFDYRFVGEGQLQKYASDYNGTRDTTIDYQVADAHIGYQYQVYSLTLDAKNIFDERYPSTESADSLRTANPQAFFVTLAVKY
jgi:iron complex outermembrane receptor protein